MNPKHPMPGKFNLLARLLHWTVAALVLAMLFIGVTMIVSVAHYGALVSIHRPLGIAILLLVLIRLVNRLLTKAPALPPTVPPSERVVAKASEALMYILLLAMPLIGWGMLSAGQYPVVMWGGFHLPPIAPVSPVLYAGLRKAHTVLAYLLFFTVLAHLSAILIHTLIIRDGLIRRMTLGLDDARQKLPGSEA